MPSSTMTAGRAGPVPPKAPAPPLQFDPLTLLDPDELGLGDSLADDHVLVDDADAVFSDSSHRQLGLDGKANLAHNDDVQDGIESLGDLEGNRDSSSGQSQDDDARSPQPHQLAGKAPPRIGPVQERHDPHPLANAASVPC